MEAKRVDLTMAVQPMMNAGPRCDRVCSLRAWTWAVRARWT